MARRPGSEAGVPVGMRAMVTPKKKLPKLSLFPDCSFLKVHPPQKYSGFCIDCNRIVVGEDLHEYFTAEEMNTMFSETKTTEKKYREPRKKKKILFVSDNEMIVNVLAMRCARKIEETWSSSGTRNKFKIEVNYKGHTITHGYDSQKAAEEMFDKIRVAIEENAA